MNQAWQEAHALHLLETEGSLTAHALAVALGQSARTAERVLRRLSEQGLLRSEGFARARRYLAPSAAKATSAPARSGLSLNGHGLAPELLRVALLLAARPSGVSPGALASRGAVPEREAARLLGSLGSVGLLAPLPGPIAGWRLHPGPERAGDTS